MEPLHRTWLENGDSLPARFLRPVLRFTRVEAAGGIVLLVAATAALIWANLPGGGSYESFWRTEIDLSLGPARLHLDLRELINDGLMALFFLVVGLEIKRELARGELRDPRKAALPVLAAVGGMALPALVYLAIAGGGGASRGWAIPVATDIAFSVGLLALLGPRVPVGARLFLLTLAIADDIGGIAIIAAVYTRRLDPWWLLGAVAALGAYWGAGRARMQPPALYALAAFACWLCLFRSGVHASLSGVALALATPAGARYADEEYRDRARRILSRYEAEAGARFGPERIDDEALTLSVVARESVAPLDRLERALHPWSSFLVVPVFALANAGVRFAGIDPADALTHRVTLATALGLLVGKTVGISVFTWAAVRLGWGRLPEATGWRHVVGLAAVAGIGFTVALFIGSLAFGDPALADRAKLGIFAGSLLAGIIGFLVLRGARPAPGVDDGAG